MKNILLNILKTLALTSVLFTAQANAIGEDDILGTWKLVDKTSGATKAVGKFYKNNAGEYAFKITEVNKQNFRGRKVIENCTGCPGKFANAPLKNLTIMWGFSAKNHDYMAGSGIDPWRKKAYKSDLHLSDSKNLIKVRKGYATNAKGMNFGKTYYLVRAN